MSPPGPTAVHPSPGGAVCSADACPLSAVFDLLGSIEASMRGEAPVRNKDCVQMQSKQGEEAPLEKIVMPGCSADHPGAGRARRSARAVVSPRSVLRPPGLAISHPESVRLEAVAGSALRGRTSIGRNGAGIRGRSEIGVVPPVSEWTVVRSRLYWQKCVAGDGHSRRGVGRQGSLGESCQRLQSMIRVCMSHRSHYPPGSRL
jgi:hypothetical protein